MMIRWFFVWIPGFPSFLQGSFGRFEANQRTNYGIKGLNYIILTQVKLLYMIKARDLVRVVMDGVIFWSSCTHSGDVL